MTATQKIEAPEWAKAELARVRFEQKAFAERASIAKASAAKLKTERKFLDALKASERAREYRNTSIDYASKAAELKATWGLR